MSDDKELSKKFSELYQVICYIDTTSHAKRIYANKLIVIPKKERLKVENEIQIHKNLNHPHIIQYKESFIFQTDNKDHLFCNIIMEFADGGNLSYIIYQQSKTQSKFSLIYILEMMIKICEGVEYCHHEKKVIHMDLKPSNILMSRGEPKIADFGISGVIEETQKQMTIKGLSCPYAAPEILAKKKIRFHGDIWALGCILYELYTLSKAYESSYTPDKILDFSEVENYSLQLKDLICNMLHVKREFRPPINVVLFILRNMISATVQPEVQNKVLIIENSAKMMGNDGLTLPPIKIGKSKGKMFFTNISEDIDPQNEGVKNVPPEDYKTIEIELIDKPKTEEELKEKDSFGLAEEKKNENEEIKNLEMDKMVEPKFDINADQLEVKELEYQQLGKKYKRSKLIIWSLIIGVCVLIILLIMLVTFNEELFHNTKTITNDDEPIEESNNCEHLKAILDENRLREYQFTEYQTGRSLDMKYSEKNIALQSQIGPLYTKLKEMQNKQPHKGFYVATANLGIYLWETEDWNKPLIDSTYQQIHIPLTYKQHNVGLGAVNQVGIFVMPDTDTAIIRFFNMKELNNPQKYVRSRQLLMPLCYFQTEEIVICCGNKTVVSYNVSEEELTEQIIYYNDGNTFNFVSCISLQNENIIVGGYFGAITIIDKTGQLITHNLEYFNLFDPTRIGIFIELRPNILINGELSGCVISNINDPLNILRTPIPDTVNTYSLISLMREGYFAIGGGFKLPTHRTFIQIYYLKSDNITTQLIKEIKHSYITTTNCILSSLIELQKGIILYYENCGNNRICIWNYAEQFEEERIVCIDNDNSDMIFNIVPYFG